MRIGMLADMYTPHVSGVTNYIRLYKREFERLGHEVFVVTYGSRDHDDDEPNVIRSRGVPYGRTGWQVPLPVSRAARKVLRSLDVMHVHHPFISGRVALHYSRSAHIPVVFTNHTRYDVYAGIYARMLPRPLSLRLMRRALRRFNRRVDMTIAPSPEIAVWLKEWGVTDDAEVFRNVIDVIPFVNPPRVPTRWELQLPEDSVIVTYLGRVAPEKNIEVLFDGFRSAAAHDDRLALLVVGDGPSREPLERGFASAGLAHRTSFVGSVDYDRVPGYLAASDIFATPSTSETWPLVVMEAGAAGLPTVGVRSPGVGELVDDNETGLLVGDDPGEFAEALLALSTDDIRRRAMSRAVRLASAGHDIRPAAARMIELYEHVIAVRAARRQA